MNASIGSLTSATELMVKYDKVDEGKNSTINKSVEKLIKKLLKS